MKRKLFYKVAGLTFGFALGEGIEVKEQLTPYEPFMTDATEELLFFMPVVASSDQQADDWEVVFQSQVEGVATEIYTDDNSSYHYVIRLESEPDMWGCVDFTSDFKNTACRIHGNESFQFFALNSALMLLYALCGVSKETLLFHASVIKHGGKGYLFLGKSGIGKSTHSRLWLKYIEGCELLNDDNPVVRLVNGKPWVYGTPWSGKTPCYKNEGVPVSGLVRLWQAPVNEIERLPVLQAYAVLLSSVSNMRWEKECADDVHAILSKMILEVPVFLLRNRLEQDAALLSFTALKAN